MLSGPVQDRDGLAFQESQGFLRFLEQTPMRRKPQL
jgi:hypothetical protein